MKNGPDLENGSLQKIDEKTDHVWDLLMEASEEVFLQVFGKKVAPILLNRVKTIDVREDKSLNGSKAFKNVLLTILGSGAFHIEKLILKNLYSRLGLRWEQKTGFEFTDYVEELNRTSHAMTQLAETHLERFYRTLLESTGDYVWAVDRKGRYLYVNSSMEKHIGFPCEEAQGKTYGDIHDADTTADFMAKVERVYEGETISYEYLRPPDGRWFLRTLSPVIDEWENIEAVSVISKEITERKHLEDKLRNIASNLEEQVKEQTEEMRFLSNIVSSINQVVVAQDKDSRITYVNKAFVNTFGYEVAEALGKSTTMLYVEDAAGEVYEKMASSLQKTGYWVGEITARRKNGETIPMLLSVSPIKNSKGKTIGTFSIGLDIAERKKLELQLQQSNERLRGLFKNAPIGILVTDKEGNSLDVNDELCRVAKASREELLKLNAFNLRDKRTEPFFEKALHGEVAEYVGPYHTTVRDTDVWRRMIFAPLFDGEGKISGVIQLNEDLTEKKELESKLQKSEERLRIIIDKAPFGFIIADVEGNFLEVNDTLCRINNVSRSELMKQNYLKFRDKRTIGLYERARGGEIVEDTGPYTTVSGAESWLRRIYVPIKDADGIVLNVLVLIEDVTEKHRLEEQLLEQNHLASIGQTALMVGHDLRNPLQAIVTNLHLIKQISEDSSESFKKLAEERGLIKRFTILDTQVQYMNKIVSNLQDYARPLTPRLLPTHLSPLIDNVFSMVKVPENIQFSKMIPDDSIKLMIDPELMLRVFINLVTNAIQAMPNGGQLTVSAAKTEEHNLLSVEDTGIGI
ncbi:PAS domain S-box protein, partial [Candidatus Bathyarchaeota archaeon]|nr:PAS domain S-box protein [Candidatus Bathyarchaeota archaeon]